MIGSPGTGKTLLSQRLATILPELEPEESLETTQIYSAVGRLEPGQPLLLTRPFRAPHHTISEAGLVGGGSIPQPGEISLSHHGILLTRFAKMNSTSLKPQENIYKKQLVSKLTRAKRVGPNPSIRCSKQPDLRVLTTNLVRCGMKPVLSWTDKTLGRQHSSC